jgi:hypothetical protein
MLPVAYLRTKRPRICPECILEHGFIEATWDLRYSIVCPVHARLSIQSCPSCDRELSWHRPGLLVCKCGADLSGMRGQQVEDDAILGLMQVIRSKVLHHPLQHAEIAAKVGLPVEHLDAMSLASLLGIIGRLDGRPPTSNGQLRRQHHGMSGGVVLRRAAHALEHWPNGFFDYLLSLEPEEGSKKGFGLRRQFESFFGAIFKAGYPAHDVAFIRAAFLKFGDDVWGQGFVTAKLERADSPESPLVGIERYAEAMGVMPSTVRRLVKHGVITGTPVTAKGRTRMLFDLRQPLPFDTTPGESLSLRKAAARLQLPISVLQRLRAEGHFEVKHLAQPAKAYHERDVKAFEEKLLQQCPMIAVRPSKACMTLSEAMAMKAGSSLIKASLIAAILQGELRPLGHHFENHEMQVFAREDIETFMQIRKEAHFGTMTVVATARLLHCDPIVVKGMFERGVLQGERKPRGVFIHASSAEAFAQEYISCAEIATRLNTQSTAIIRQCAGSSIEWHPRGNNASGQPFIKRNLAEVLFGQFVTQRQHS